MRSSSGHTDGMPSELRSSATDTIGTDRALANDICPESGPIKTAEGANFRTSASRSTGGG
jgi:hypothetical protein